MLHLKREKSQIEDRDEQIDQKIVEVVLQLQRLVFVKSRQR